VAFGLPNGQNFEHDRILAIADSLSADQSRIAGIYEERSGLQKDQALSLFDGQKTYSATKAQTFGFVHEIRSLEIQPGCAVLHINAI
jgi:ATP-dependent protease ClpP protease subunit